jgi:hypothetical protein
MLSREKLESELSVVFRHGTFTNVESACALWNLVKENTFSKVHELMEIRVVQTTPSLNWGV